MRIKAKLMKACLRVARSYSKSLIVIITLATLAAATLLASAQQPASITMQQGRLSPQGLYAIRNARIVTVSGPTIESGTVVIRDGKIEAVGAGVNVPSGAQELDATGLSVYPGMIDLGTSLGLVEVEAGAPGTVDLTEVGDMNPNAQAFFGINPHSAHVTVTRANGVTTVLSSPRGGIISGQAALINLDGTTPREMAVTPQAALVITFPRASAGGRRDFATTPEAANTLTEAITTRDRQIEQLRKLLRDAEAYGKAQDAYARDKSLPRPDQNVVLSALAPYARGERPVIMRADREVEIRAAIRFAEEMRLKPPIIMGGNDAWKIASFLRERNVSVILTGVLDLPNREDDYYDQLYANAARLHEAGVRFAISTGDTGAQVRDLPYHAGMAAAFGLPRDEALKAVTLYPAQIMGASDRLGSIEPGKLANLVVTDGDMLEARTHIRHLFIAGRSVSLANRQTEL
ncbi:MAG TPA: amidohydrolase family protein, partial [Pyrinomonadaceae bacterium]|nr:amidohydrolase family protein [Pyrinomonadaceae bacterium]